MTIKVGDTIPSMKLMVATAEGPKEISTDEIFKGRRWCVRGPGRFHPDLQCQASARFRAERRCAKGQGHRHHRLHRGQRCLRHGRLGQGPGHRRQSPMLADGAAAFAKAIGLELDLNARGMGGAASATPWSPRTARSPIWCRSTRRI